ncbi:MAG: alpha/beta hydrolase [Alphaproteobacteria bacterium GM202ARS2]|nr:alpha/beta hydrolase [Alphaproteobacteria bacterium GM202ARS2]
MKLADLTIKKHVVAFASIVAAMSSLSVASLAIERVTELPDGTTVEAIYDYVTVPLRHNDDTEETLQLSYIRVPAETPSTLPPVIYLAGGPGDSGTAALADDHLGALLDDLRKTRDVIFLDQRGTGETPSSLDCFLHLQLPLAPAPDIHDRYRANEALSRQCAYWLKTSEVDLAAYNVVESADDIAALVERALLAGVVGPNDSFAEPMQLDTVLERLDRLARDPSMEWPLDALPTTAVAEALAHYKTPRRASFQDEFGRQIDVDITRDDAVRVLFDDVADGLHWSRLASHITALGNSDLSDLAERISHWRKAYANASVKVSNRCKSFATHQTLSAIEAHSKRSIAGNFLVFPFPAICDAWGIRPFSDGHREPVQSHLPVLMIAGNLDAVTPIEDAKRVASSLTDAVVLEIQGMGHQAINAYESIVPVRDMVLAFFNDDPVHSGTYRYDFTFEPMANQDDGR